MVENQRFFEKENGTINPVIPSNTRFVHNKIGESNLRFSPHFYFVKVTNNSATKKQEFKQPINFKRPFVFPYSAVSAIWGDGFLRKRDLPLP